MSTATFNSLGNFSKLKDAGIPEEQARAHVEVLQNLVDSCDASQRADLATKADLFETKHEILKWVVSGMIAQTALIVAVLAFLK